MTDSFEYNTIAAADFLVNLLRFKAFSANLMGEGK